MTQRWIAALQRVAAALSVACLWGSTLCLAITANDVNRINAACAVCDQNFTVYVGGYQNNFYEGFNIKSSDPLDVANFHCSRMALVSQCYVDCLQGYSVVYASAAHTLFMQFNRQFCDTDCRLAFLPYCYLSQGLGYNLYRTGCDENQHMLLPSISACISYWASAQRCSGLCTPGQRALSTMTLMLESICRIPILADDCGTNVNACMEQTFGPYGTKFLELINITAIPSNITCSRFYDSFFACLDNTVNGQTTIGSGPVQYRVTYDSPCRQYEDAIDTLHSLAAAALKPLCDGPTVNLTSYCTDSLQATTIARTTMSTTKAAVSRATRYTGPTVAGSQLQQTTPSSTAHVANVVDMDATSTPRPNRVDGASSSTTSTADNAPAKNLGGRAFEVKANLGLRLGGPHTLLGLCISVAALVRCLYNTL